MPDALQNIEGINYEAALARFGSEDAYISIIKSFIEHTPKLLEKTQIVTRDSLHDYAVTVHGIKGTGRAIGADTLGLKAEELEHAAKNDRTGFCRAGNIPFQQMAWKLIADLRDYLALRGEPEETREERDAPDARLLAALKNACTKYEIAEVDEIMGELETYTYKTHGELVTKLRTMLDVSDFSSVAELLSVFEYPAVE
jgi:HPt (histidine-containing phosphotransfer) domain-containing protein